MDMSEWLLMEKDAFSLQNVVVIASTSRAYLQKPTSKSTGCMKGADNHLSLRISDMEESRMLQHNWDTMETITDLS